MTTQFEEKAIPQSVEYDPFPQPQTIPEGWDVSVLMYEWKTVGAVVKATDIDTQ
jgi:hypothetical protein